MPNRQECAVNVMTSPMPSGELAGFDDVVARMMPLERLNRERDALRAQYLAGKPYPHVVIDGFFDPAVLDRMAADFPRRGGRDWISYDTVNEIKQTSRGIVGVSAFAQAFLWQANSQPFLDFLGYLTGCGDLAADPTFHGGGLHESFRGGWLNVHTDWTQHPALPLVRRLNLIVYLNRDWDPDWGGGLDLCDPATKERGVTVAPLFNRAVIFPTNEATPHGFPDPISCPEDRSRKSVSLFYWSPDPEAVKKGTFITFLPGNRGTRAKALMRSFIPPVAFTARDSVKALLKGRRPG